MENNPQATAVAGIKNILKSSKDPAATGLMAIIPIMVSLVAVNWLLHFVSGIPGTAMFEITSSFYLNQAIKLAALSVTGGFFITSLGNFLETRHGFKTEKVIDNCFDRVPLLRSVYNASKVTAETVLGGTEDLGKPVKIDMGKLEITGFKTGNRTAEGKHLIFIPTSPNITSGFVVEMDDKWLQKTEETVSDAITKVLSAGFGAEVKNATKVPTSKQERL